MHRKYVTLITLSIFGSALLLHFTLESSDTDNQVEEDAPYPTENDQDAVIWIGPGIYYGLWFGSEFEYNDWYDHHYNNHYDHRHRGDRGSHDHESREHERRESGEHRDEHGGGGRHR